MESTRIATKGFSLMLVVVALAASGLLVRTLSALFLVFAGVLFAIFVNGLGHWLSARARISYRLAFVTIVTMLLLLLIGGVWFMGSSIAQQVSALAGELTSSSEQILERWQHTGWIQRVVPQLQGSTGSIGEILLPTVKLATQGLFWILTSAVIVFFVGVYIAYEPDLYRTGLVKLFPLRRRSRIEESLEALRSTLTYWIIARLVSMTLVGVLTATVLALMGVPLPMTLGVLAALLTFMPNVGPILAAVPQTLLAMKIGPLTALYVLLFNIALQAIESYLLTPLIERKQVSLPPALTITAQLVLGVIVGTVGVMVAAPFTAGTMLLVQMLYIRDRLGDPSPGELAESRA